MGFNTSASSEKSLKIYLEELAMEHHRLSLQNDLIDIDQWKGHSVGVDQCRMKMGLILTGVGDKVMCLWSLESYKCLEEYSIPDMVPLVDFDFDESKIVGLIGTRICIWRRTGKRSIFPSHEGTFMKGLCMRYIDPEAVVGCEDGTARVFDMYSRKCSQIIRMKRALSRYNRNQNSSDVAVVEYKAEKQDSKEMDILKDEIANLQMKQLRLLGKELAGLSLKELQQLEQQLNEGLLSVKERKEQLLMEQLEQSRVQEQRAMLENETLRRQVEELRGFFPSIEHSVPSYLEYHPIEKKNSLLNNVRPEVVCNCAMEKGDSDTTLHLGLSSDVYHKRKAPEREIYSNN